MLKYEVILKMFELLYYNLLIISLLKLGDKRKSLRLRIFIFTKLGNNRFLG